MLHLCCLLLSVLRVYGIPYYNGSFVASGEFQRTNFKVSGISHPYELSVFEEAYDSIEKRAAFRVTKKGDVMTYIQDLRSKRSYLIRTYGGTTTCVKVPNANFTRNQFMTVVSAPDERMYFFLRDLLVLRSYVKVQTRKNDLVRNQPCRIHGIHTNNYTIRGSMTWTFTPNEYQKYTCVIPQQICDSILVVISVKLPLTALFTEKIGNLTKRNLKRPPANITGLPLAMTFPRNATLEVPFEAHFTFRDDGYSEQRITMSILNFDYIGTTLRNTLFEIPDGVRCEGNTKSGLPHPVYDNMRVFSYRARVKSSTWKRHHIIHGAIDTNRKLHRLDYKPWRSTSSRERTIIFSGREGLVYNISQSRVCSVGNITDVVFDKQMVLHPGFIESISPKTLFVGNSPATLAYKKIAVKGGIPCHVWDIVRFDWPSNGVKTLWEWCFVDRSYFSQPSAATSSHVVSLDIHVLELPPAPSFGLEPTETLSFQFFDFNKRPSAPVELGGFDISSCYNATSPEKKIELPLEGQSPPFYNGSFRAIGEIVRMRPSDDSSLIVKEVLFFEELYDSTNLKAALRIHTSNETSTYFQDIETRQTFLYTASAHSATCNLIKPSSDIVGPLETKDGWPYFYLRDLLTSTHWNTTPDEAHYPARNMSCDVWITETMHKGRPLIVAMAVNSRSWGSTTGTMQAPVSVHIRYTNSEDDDDIEINIFDFGAFGDHIHDDLLQLPDGVFCGGYKKAVSLPPLRDLKVFNYRVEMTSSDYSATHYSDVWVNLDRMLYRIDYEPSNGTVSRRKRALIVSGNEDAIYQITQKKNIRCKVKSILDLKFDVQMITDPSLIKHMTPATIFSGDNDNIKLTYKKQKGEEGKRSSGNTYMVSLDITVLQVPSDSESSLPLNEGTRLSYHFYDSFKNPPELIDLHGFDISPCYKGNDSVDAYLEVKLSSPDYSTLSSVSTINDPKFLSAWRMALDQASSLSDHSLRITRVRGYFTEDDTLLITFTLLDRFPADAEVDIVDNQVDLEGMQDNLNKSVSEGSLGITYKGVNLTASSWGLGLPLTLKPGPAPPPTTVETTSIQTTAMAETTPTEEGTTAASSRATTSADVSTTSWEVITDPVVTDEKTHDWDTTTTFPHDIITELPEAYSAMAMRYSPGVVGGTTAGLFLLGALIGASATYVKSAFFSTVSLPTMVFH
ncbi:uncharacterized protein LOC119172824 isoform X3 [Rhipicephalus microplus]|uniref:uncharacterized protein LOC119172824 isoform X3 n=1 Tax=Rhipicephalus microplus TaxID=6941 RepID=UPI003F6C8702